MKNDESAPVQIERPIYKIEELNRDHLYEKPYSTRKYKIIFMYHAYNIQDGHPGTTSIENDL